MYKKIIPLVIVLIVLILAYFASLALKDHSLQKSLTSTPIEQNTPNIPPPTPPKSKYPEIEGHAVYTSKDGYSFNYPSTLFKPFKKTITVPTAPKKAGGPNGKQTISVNAFKHEIQTEHCALSGVCTMTTIDMSFGSFIRKEDFKPENYPNISWEPYYYSDGTISSLKSYTEGVEGEGMVYSFLPYSDGETLIFFRSYIDESILSRYKNDPDFLPLEQQKLIYESIIGSLD